MNKTLSKNTLLVHSGSNPKMALGLKVLNKKFSHLSEVMNFSYFNGYTGCDKSNTKS